MKYAALITAAGLSSRMNDFKPMMEIGGVSMINRIINTFKTAGCDEIIVITGRDADKLEASVREPLVRFIRNENFANTQMLDSIKLGLNAVKTTCDFVLFTPVDAPLFTLDTVKTIKEASGEIVIPTFKGEYGHPVRLSSGIIPYILSYDGEGGLRGAINLSDKEIITVPVNDEGCIYDADTKEDFNRLLSIHSRMTNS